MSRPPRSGPGLAARALRFAGAAGSSIAAPDAALWVTDFLNAAYYARPREERSVEDLRLAFALLTTRWHQKGHRRLRAGDLVAFHLAFGRARFRSRDGRGRLSHNVLLDGGERLLGRGFAGGYADPGRRGWGIVFDSPDDRRDYRPEARLRHARLGRLSPPRDSDPRWTTYRAVPVDDLELTRQRLLTPASWPDFGSDHGRFTALRSGGLDGQTFEIEVVAGAATRHPMLTRGYVTVTRIEDAGGPAGLEELVAEMDQGLAPSGLRALPDGHRPVAIVVLTTHDGHFMGPAKSHLVLSAPIPDGPPAHRETGIAPLRSASSLSDGAGGPALRDVGVWEPLAFPQSVAYRLGGREAQHAFWGEADPANSMLHQLARRDPTA